MQSSHFFLLNYKKPKVEIKTKRLVSKAIAPVLNSVKETSNTSPIHFNSAGPTHLEVANFKDYGDDQELILNTPQVNMSPSLISTPGLNSSQLVKLKRNNKDNLDFAKIDLSKLDAWKEILDTSSVTMESLNLIPEEIDLISSESLQKILTNVPLLEEKRILKLREFLQKSKREKGRYLNIIPKSINSKNICEHLENVQNFLQKENIMSEEWIKIFKAGLTNQQLEKINDCILNNELIINNKKFVDVKNQIRKILDNKPTSYYKGKLYNYKPQKFNDIALDKYCEKFLEIFKASEIEEQEAMELFYQSLPSNLKIELKRFDSNIEEQKNYENLKDFIKVIKDSPII
jgi:hypothetical protein